VNTGDLIQVFGGQIGEVFCLAFSPDGKRILSGASNGKLLLWDTATGALIRSFEGLSGKVFAVAFSPNGSHILSASDDAAPQFWNAMVRTWDVTTGQQTAQFSVSP
jgi:WD40 repeat protein